VVEHPLHADHGHAQKASDSDRRDVSALCGAVGRVSLNSEILLARFRDAQRQRALVLFHSHSTPNSFIMTLSFSLVSIRCQVSLRNYDPHGIVRVTEEEKRAWPPRKRSSFR